MMTDTQVQSTQKARQRSDVYGFLATALRFPDASAWNTLNDADRWSGSLELREQTDPNVCELLQDAREAARPTHGGQEVLIDALQRSHTRLFGHAVRGACPPYELEYNRSDIPQQASELADIAGFYNAFGMELDAKAHERADHAAVQCEFMSVLAAKEVYAIQTDNPEAQQICHDAQRSFVADHIGRWFPAFATRLQDADPDGFYGKLGKFAREFIKSECRRFHAACGPQFLELRPIDPARDAAIQCGVEESCPGASSGPQRGSQALVQLGIDRR